jgi:formiminotetrahydrofolate cyclodeaminase
MLHVDFNLRKMGDIEGHSDIMGQKDRFLQSSKSLLEEIMEIVEKRLENS